VHDSGKFHVIGWISRHGLTRAPEGYELTGAGLGTLSTLRSELALPKFAVAGNSMARRGLAARRAHPERIDALIWWTPRLSE